MDPFQPSQPLTEPSAAEERLTLAPQPSSACSLSSAETERESPLDEVGRPLEKAGNWRTWWAIGGVALILGGGVFYPVYSCFQPLQRRPQPKLVDIPEGASLDRIAHLLAQQGVIRQAWAFSWLARRQGRARVLHPGRYLLSPHQTPQTILEQLVAGNVIVVKITFPEGFTLEQMAARAQDQGLGRAARYRELASREAASFGVKGLPHGHSLEGYLFPDTYQLPWGADERALIRLQVDRFEEVWAELEKRYPSQKSRHEVVTLASLIEREAKVEADRRLIAGVLHNRLTRGWRLEVDATVLYALGQHKARLLYQDLQVDSPYNTYRHSGLPPGPIANPGRASLEAALNPAPTDCLYYVARPDGSHLFSRTLADHNRAKQQIRQASKG